jgi:hypothetical protein
LVLVPSMIAKTKLVSFFLSFFLIFGWRKNRTKKKKPLRDKRCRKKKSSSFPFFSLPPPFHQLSFLLFYLLFSSFFIFLAFLFLGEQQVYVFIKKEKF